MLLACTGGTTATPDGASPNTGGSISSTSSTTAGGTTAGSSKSSSAAGGTTANSSKGSTAAGGTTASSSTGSTAAAGGSDEPGANCEDFELSGSWLYLGPWDGEHTLSISSQSLEYADINQGWKASFGLKTCDNDLDRFEIVFGSGDGEYSPVGEEFSGTYVLQDAILTLQLKQGLNNFVPVQSPGSCTAEPGGEAIPDCKLYMRQP